MRDDAVERLFSLFTSSDRAEAIAGDLAEEREQRGWIWFWLHVVRVTFALVAQRRDGGTAASARAHAGRMRALVRAGIRRSRGGLSVSPLVGSPVGWIALSFFWCGGALCDRRLSGRHRAAARHGGVRDLAVVGAALLMAFGATVEPRVAAETDLSSSRDWRTRGDRCWQVAQSLAGGRSSSPFPSPSRSGSLPPVLFVMPATSSPAAQQTEWKDPSPHKTTLVTVEDGVQLEVLDWGGSGPALVLLAGLGATAHHYDDFAPALTARYRVVGVTRRGHRGSSAAARRLRIRAPG